MCVCDENCDISCSRPNFRKHKAVADNQSNEDVADGADAMIADDNLTAGCDAPDDY